MIQIAHRADARSKTLLAIAAAISLGVALTLLFIGMVARTHAVGGTTVYVTPTNSQGWTADAPLADVRGGGSVTFVADADTPYGDGALSLITGDTTADKAQYMHAAGGLLSSYTTLEYSTKQVSASFEAGLPSFQLVVCLYGVNAETGGCAVVPGTTTSSFTTLVYEPYVDKGNAAVVPNTWQTWDVDAGQVWSSKAIAGLGAQNPTYSLSALKEQFPQAVLTAYGVNVGTYNPAYNTRVDGVVVNETTYDFELVAPVPPKPTPTDKDACKNGGWTSLYTATGATFKNQGQCVSYVAAGKQ